jgi:hypothetical protein
MTWLVQAIALSSMNEFLTSVISSLKTLCRAGPCVQRRKFDPSRIYTGRNTILDTDLYLFVFVCPSSQQSNYQYNN